MIDFVRESIEYVDKLYEENKNVFEELYSYAKYKFSDDKKITFYNNNNDKIVEYNYEVLGKYNYNENVWVWGWSIPYLNKEKINISKNILLYGINIQKPQYIKDILITSHNKLTNEIQLEIFLSIGLYLSKKKIYYKCNIDKILNNEIYNNDNDDNIYSTYFIIINKL
jgi:hypothetical protein